VAGPELDAVGVPSAAPVERARRVPLGRELLLVVVLAAVLTAVVKDFAVEAFRIPSGSMEDTLRPGDRVLVNRLAYHVRGVDRGDVVVFSGAGSWDSPPPARPGGLIARAYHRTLELLGIESTGTDYVKRVIGLPGDRVSCCDAAGRITVNGVPLEERSYLFPGNQPSAQRFSVTVPPGRLWVMGDHRAESADSRHHRTDPGDGTIPESAVIGRVFLVIWPPAQLSEVPIPATFAQHQLDAVVAPPMPLAARGYQPSVAGGCLLPAMSGCLPLAAGGHMSAARAHTFRWPGARLRGNER
jgi:signal peptidase I